MVRKVEDEPVRSSVTNHPTEERVSRRKRRSNRTKTESAAGSTKRSVGTFHRVVLESGGTQSQVARS